MMGHKGLPSFAFLGHHEPGGALQTPSVRRRHEQRHYLEFRGGGDRQQLQKHRLPRSIGRSASPNFCELVHRLTSTTNEGYGPATRLGSLKTANTHKHHLSPRVCAFTWLRPFGKARPGDSASGSTSSPLPSVKFRSFTPLQLATVQSRTPLFYVKTEAGQDSTPQHQGVLVAARIMAQRISESS